MAVRTFLKLRNDDDIQEMSSDEMDTLVKFAVREFAQNPTVILQRVTSGGSLGSFRNSVLVPGSAVSTSSSFYNQANTPDVVEVNNDVSHLNVSTTSIPSAPTDTNNIRFPVYLDGSNNIAACSLQDMIDTIYGPAIDYLATSSEDPEVVGGTYAVYRSGQAPANTTLVSSDRVYRDTRNNASYSSNESVPYSTSGTIGTVDDWFLYKFNTPAVPTLTGGGAAIFPLKITNNTTSSIGLRPFTQAEWEPLIEEGVRHTSVNVTGYRLSYNINGSGTQKGQTITDTRRTASRYITDQDGDTYYSQEVPDGSHSTVRSYILRLNKS